VQTPSTRPTEMIIPSFESKIALAIGLLNHRSE
jgi:hypothetical protein